MIQLIDNWKDSWKFASVQLSTLGLVVFGILELANQAWLALPVEVQAQVPHATKISLVLFAATLFGRLFKLKEKASDDSQQP